MFGECHAHIFMNGKNYREAVELHKGHVAESDIRKHFQEYADRGVTFVRDGGDALSVSARAKEIAGEYGIDYRTPVFAIHKKGHYGGIVGCQFENMREYHELVKKVKAQGGDFIKIMVSGIVDFDEVGVITGTPLEQKEIFEMVHIAHEEGFAVMVHGNGSRAVEVAVCAGADSIEHGNAIDEACIRTMAQHDVVWVPTVVTIKNLMGCGRFNEEAVAETYARAAANIRLAYQCGVQMALGSDAGAYLVPHGEGIVQEYEVFEQLLQNPEMVRSYLTAGERKISGKFKRG